jgi:hypothetical protein
MSKSFNSRYKYKHNKEVTEYPRGLKTTWKEYKPGDTSYFDYSFTTEKKFNSLNDTLNNCRHPNKKRNRRLLKEFKTTGVLYKGNNLVGFDSRWGDIYERRLNKSIKRRGRELRRSRLKKQTQRMIDNEI